MNFLAHPHSHLSIVGKEKIDQNLYLTLAHYLQHGSPLNALKTHVWLQIYGVTEA